MKDDLREKGPSGEEVYDRAAWRQLSSRIDPTLKWDKDEEEDIADQVPLLCDIRYDFSTAGQCLFMTHFGL